MSVGRTLSRNFTIQLAGKALSVLLGLAVIAILTRSLGVEGYGEYTTSVTFLQFFGVIVDFGLTLTMLVMISEQGAEEERLVGNILGLRLFSSALVYMLAPLAVMPFPWSPTVKLAVAVGAAAYFFMSSAGMLLGIFQKHAAIWRASLAEIASRVVLVGLTGALALMGYGVVPMLGAQILANALWLFLLIRFAKPYVSVKPLADLAVWKKTIQRSWPIAVSIFFNLLYLKGDVLILAYFRPESEVGFYGAAYKVLDVLTALPTMFMGLLLPSLTFDWSAQRRPEFGRHLRRTFDLFLTAAIPSVAGGIAVAGPLVRFLAGSGYDTAASVLKILLFAVPGIFLGALYGHAVIAVNRQKRMVYGYAATAVLTIAAYLYLIPRYGLWGAAFATIASETLIAILTFATVYGAAKVRPSFVIAAKALACSLVMYGALVLLPPWNVVVLVLIGSVVYLALMILVRGITKEELRSLIPHRPSTDETADLIG
jgi:O-antigen/teichoic acid export membrane protein